MGRVMLEFKLPVSILREGKKFIAYTPALDLSTSGDSHKEVRERFSEIVNIFFEEVVKKGTLDEVLRSSGWRRIRTKWQPPIVISQESQTVRVPAK